MLTVDSTTSPIFIGLLGAGMLFLVFAVQGILYGRLPNMLTSPRGARVSGFMSLLGLIMVMGSMWFFYQQIELYGTALALMAGLTFLLGISLSERII